MFFTAAVVSLCYCFVHGVPSLSDLAVGAMTFLLSSGHAHFCG